MSQCCFPGCQSSSCSGQALVAVPHKEGVISIGLCVYLVLGGILTGQGDAGITAEE